MDLCNHHDCHQAEELEPNVPESSNKSMCQTHRPTLAIIILQHPISAVKPSEFRKNSPFSALANPLSPLPCPPHPFPMRMMVP